MDSTPRKGKSSQKRRAYVFTTEQKELMVAAFNDPQHYLRLTTKTEGTSTMYCLAANGQHFPPDWNIPDGARYKQAFDGIALYFESVGQSAYVQTFRLTPDGLDVANGLSADCGG